MEAAEEQEGLTTNQTAYPVEAGTARRNLATCDLTARRRSEHGKAAPTRHQQHLRPNLRAHGKGEITGSLG
jgi:hypothetical protein